MNIFKSLSLGDGRISETNMTSFLSYLLNSSNELDNSFLILFFNQIDAHLSENRVNDLLSLSTGSVREQIVSFTKQYTAIAEPEFSVKNNSSRQDIDVFLKISRKKDDTDVAYILIENKVKVSSKKNMQLAAQFNNFIQTEDYINGLPVYSVLLTTDFDSFNSMYMHALEQNKNSVWLRWTNQKNTEDSIESILRRLIILEQQAEIQPINPNTQYILKSFIDYIVTELSNPSTGQRNFSFNGSDEVDFAKVNVDNKVYNLRRYENKMIRAFDENDEELNIEVLPLLRRINDLYELNVSRTHPTGTPKNTQIFGKEVISAFNFRNQTSQ